MSYLREALNESFLLFEVLINHLDKDIIDTVEEYTEDNIPKEYVVDPGEKCSKSAAKNILISAIKQEPAILYIGTVATNEKDKKNILKSGEDIRSHVWVKVLSGKQERILQTGVSNSKENIDNLIPMTSIEFSADMSFEDRKNKLIKELNK